MWEPWNWKKFVSLTKAMEKYDNGGVNYKYQGRASYGCDETESHDGKNESNGQRRLTWLIVVGPERL